jgi:CheY-like chemotaxis protein
LSDVLTFLLIELDQLSRARLGELVGQAVLDAGGAVVAAGDGSSEVTAAVFHLATDATRTAVDLAGRLADQIASEPPRRPVPWMRMALCTGAAHDDASTLAGPAWQRAGSLLRLTGPNQVLLAASTATVASAGLPRGTELVDHGVRPLGPGRPPERVYELRGGTGRRDTTSNLDWARRAAPGSVLGREEPLAVLDAGWKTALDGRPQVAVLSGEGGIGKTTVAAELALRRHAEGATVLYGRWDQGSLAPYQATREALGTYAQTCPPAQLRAELEGRSDEVARLLPDVAARLGGVRPPLRGDPEGERLRLFEAIEVWLARIARRHPLLVVLDDLHWAGRSSLQLVDHLRHMPAPVPLMLVLTVRDGEVDPDLRPLLDQLAAGVGDAVGPVERIELTGLERGVVAQLVEQAVGDQVAPDDEVVDWLTTETSGNPLFVQEILRGVRDDVDPAASLRAARHELPDQLSDMVRWRLRQLPRHTGDVLATAAVIGSSFDVDVLSSVLGTAPGLLRPVLAAAEQAGLLRGPEDGAASCTFAHEVLRRALLDDVHDPEQRRALHRRVATALANRARAGEAVVASDVAQHHLQGADLQTVGAAVRWARNAAEAARRETAFESAVRLLTQAVDVHDRFGVGGPAVADTDAEDLQALACELRLELAEAHDRAGDFTARDHCHVEAAELARDLGRTHLFVRAALGYGGRLPAAAPPNPTARRLLDEALGMLPDDDSRERALLLARLGQTVHFDAPHDERSRLADGAVAMARRLDAPVVMATTLLARCMALSGPDDVEAQMTDSAEVIRIGERSGDPDLVLQAIRVQVPALLTLGREREARDLADTFTNLAAQVRHPDHFRLATMWEVFWATLEGRYEEAERQAVELRGRLRQAGHPHSRVIRLAQSFPVLWLRGGEVDPTRVGAALDKEDFPSPSAWAFATWVEYVSGQPAARDRALGRLAEEDPAAFVAAVPDDFVWWPTMISCTLVAADGHPDWAAPLLDRIDAHAGRNVVVGHTAFFGAVDHHRGTLALVLDRNDEAIDLLEQGLERHGSLAAEPFVALSQRWLAEALRRRDRDGDAARIASLHQASEEAAARLGLHGLPDFDQPADVAR